jgi:hypothetical protein
MVIYKKELASNKPFCSRFKNGSRILIKSNHQHSLKLWMVTFCFYHLMLVLMLRKQSLTLAPDKQTNFSPFLFCEVTLTKSS